MTSVFQVYIGLAPLTSSGLAGAATTVLAICNWTGVVYIEKMGRRTWLLAGAVLQSLFLAGGEIFLADLAHFLDRTELTQSVDSLHWPPRIPRGKDWSRCCRYDFPLYCCLRTWLGAIFCEYWSTGPRSNVTKLIFFVVCLHF